MGRGRAGALVFVLLVGLNPASFTADAEGEGAAGRLGWRDTKTFSYVTFYSCGQKFAPTQGQVMLRPKNKSCQVRWWKRHALDLFCCQWDWYVVKMESEK